MLNTKTISQQVELLFGKRNHLELTIGVLKDGKIEFRHWNPDKSTDNKLIQYPVGSICKTFTTSLMAKDMAEERLDLHAPLSEYIKPLPERYYPNLERLATHSSGLGGQPFGTLETLRVFARMNKPGGLFHTNPFHGRLDEAGLRQILAETKLQDKVYPFKYSNFGFGTLGVIVGGVTGQGFWERMNEYTSQELGLADTYLGNTPLLGYDKAENPCEQWQWSLEDVIAPAGALLSTAPDLLRYAQMQMDGSLPYVKTCHERHGAGEKSFDSGLAWRLLKGTEISYHVGSAGAFSAYLGMDRSKQTAVVMATNYGLAEVEKPGLAILQSL